MLQDTNLPSCDNPRPFLQKTPNRIFEEKADVFSVWGATVATGNTPQMEEIRMLTSPDLHKLGCDENTGIQWQLAMWGREIEQVGENISPANVNEVTEAQHHSMLKGRVEFYGAGGQTVRDFDIGAGIRFGVVSTKVQLKLLAPTGYLRNPDPDATLSGLTLTSRIGAALMPAPCPPGRQSLTNTFVYRIAAGNNLTGALVPPGAKRVSIYQTADGVVLTPRWVNVNQLVVAANLGEITLGADRRVEHLEVPGPSKVIHLNPAADQQNVRWVTVVWELEI
jgi:hypothetical protein